MHVLLTALTYGTDQQEDGRLDEIRKEMGISKSSFYQINTKNNKHQSLQSYTFPKDASYNRAMTTLNKKQCIDLFCHSDESSTIDSNSRDVMAIVDGVPHAGRIWTTNTLRKQYEIFKQSHAVEQFKRMNSEFIAPSKSFFRKHKCSKCVSKQKCAVVWT